MGEIEASTIDYSYDPLYRLTGADYDDGSYLQYSYDAVSNRLQQTVNGVSTNYSLDINASLTQVLADGPNAYLYGLGRIGELQPDGWMYHLPDALGSVRQISGSDAALALAQSYEPFGDILTSDGNGESVFQYTGEMRDATGLTFLRARYLDNGVGRFLRKDTWSGNNQLPATYNPYLYALNNPVAYTDPGGQYCIAGYDVAPWGRKCTEQDRENAALAFEYMRGFVSSPNYALGFAYELLDSMLVVGPETVNAVGEVLLSTDIGKTLQLISYISLPLFINECRAERLSNSQVVEFIRSVQTSVAILKGNYYFNAGRVMGRTIALGMGLGYLISGIGIAISSQPVAILATASGPVTGGGGVGITVAIEVVNAAVLVRGASVVGSVVIKEFNDNLMINYFSRAGGGGGRNLQWRPLRLEDLPDAYEPPRTGPRKVTVQHGPRRGRVGWLDKDGNIWVPSKLGESHGGPHWDVQLNGGKGGYINVNP